MQCRGRADSGCLKKKGGKDYFRTIKIAADLPQKKEKERTRVMLKRQEGWRCLNFFSSARKREEDVKEKGRLSILLGLCLGEKRRGEKPTACRAGKGKEALQRKPSEKEGGKRSAMSRAGREGRSDAYGREGIFVCLQSFCGERGGRRGNVITLHRPKKRGGKKITVASEHNMASPPEERVRHHAEKGKGGERKEGHEAPRLQEFNHLAGCFLFRCAKKKKKEEVPGWSNSRRGKMKASEPADEYLSVHLSTEREKRGKRERTFSFNGGGESDFFIAALNPQEFFINI